MKRLLIVVIVNIVLAIGIFVIDQRMPTLLSNEIVLFGLIGVIGLVEILYLGRR